MTRLSAVRQDESMDYFASSRQLFNELIECLSSDETTKMDHGELEKYIQIEGRELLRQLLEDHLKNRGNGDVGLSVTNAAGTELTHKRESDRSLQSIFGEVTVDRMGYSKPGETSLFPKDKELNLPDELYSHGLRKLVAINASKDSFDETIESVKCATGVDIPKRQAEQLIKKASQDFEEFYKKQELESSELKTGFVVLTMDSKGIVMRKDSLTENTQKRADESESKLSKRVSKGEKANRKRMATVASVYEIEPFERTPEEICSDLKPVRDTVAVKRPRPQRKRVWASIERTSEDVTTEVFEHAEKNNPNNSKPWLVLVDGEPRQIDRIETEAKKRGITVTIILDIIHVNEYLWKASRVFNEETSQEAQDWVMERLLEILKGNSSNVAAGIRRSATLRNLTETERVPADKCADYLLNKSEYLKYHDYLKKGYPIATGIIEGACRYLIKDRMDITGARWSLKGAEAVLKLRSLRASGDFEEYWSFHEEKELERVHFVKYKKKKANKLKLLK